MDYTRFYSIIPYLHFIHTYDILIITNLCLLWTYFRFSEPNFADAYWLLYIYMSFLPPGRMFNVCSTGIWFYVAFVTVTGTFGVYHKQNKMLTLDVQAIQFKRLKHCLFKILRHRKGQWSLFWDMIPLFLVEKHPQQQDVQLFFENEVSSWWPLTS